MRFFVRCNKEGTITSAMRVDIMDEALEHPYGYLEEGEVVVEVGMPKGVEAVYCHEIGQLFKVNIEKKKLKKLAVKKSAKKTPAKKTPAKKASAKKTAAKPRRAPRS